MNANTGVRITDMRPDTSFTPGSPPTPGYRVDFVTPSGISSHVIVPRSTELERDVHEAVQAESDRIEAALTSHPYEPRRRR